MFRSLAVATALLLPAAALAQEIDPDRLNAHTRELASDAFAGRGPASPEEHLTTDYIAEQFRALGLEPGGDEGTFFQVVPLSRTQQSGPATITAEGPTGWTRAFERGPDILVASDRPVPRITLTDAPVVFAGYGVDAPERDWDDFGDMDLTGKIILVIVNDPDFGAPEGHPVEGLFDGRAMTYYGRWVYKFAEAAEQGAAGVLVIHDTAGAGYPWSVLENSSAAPDFDIVRENWEAERVPVQDVKLFVSAVQISREVGGNLAESLTILAETLRRRLIMEGKVKALTAQGRLQGIVMAMLPVAMVGFLAFAYPETMRPMFHTPVGWAVIAVCAVMEYLGYRMCRKIMTIDV